MPRIALSLISPDPKQPRKLFDVEKLEELASSLQFNGQLQAITVRPADEEGQFWVCYGERRWRAHKLLAERGIKGFDQIDAVVVEAGNVADLRVKQIVENVARADMTPLEEAQGYADLLEMMTGEEAARRIGLSLAKFNARLSLVNLENGIAKLLAGKQIDASQAQEIARLPRHEDQLKILRMLNRGEIGKWKSLKAAVDALIGGDEQVDMFGPSAPAVSSEDVQALNGMERKIEALAAKLAGGWKDGECIIANRVSPDRAARMADQLAAIRISVRQMEQALRNVTAQARLAAAE
jgi:ParB family chromosome partitioning protein